MIIQIRGTSGSGKSTAMKAFMERTEWNSVCVKGRKRPLYYVTKIANKCVVVLGHYESACGGCDTIGSARAVYELIMGLTAIGVDHFICEGLLLSEDVKWSSQLKDLHVIYLVTPLEQCLRQIEGRRAEAGNEKPLNPANTTNRVAVIERSRVKLLDAGVPCYRLSSQQVPGAITNLLRLHAK